MEKLQGWLGHLNSSRHRWMAMIPAMLLSVAFFINSHIATPDIPDFGFAAQDKFMHAGAYGLLALLVLFGIRYGLAEQTRRRISAYHLALGYSLLYGLSDEMHQAFVAGRTAEVSDWVADGVGALLAVAIAAMFATRRANRRSASRCTD